MPRRPTTLSSRLALLVAGVVVLTALVVGVFGSTLLQRANDQAARRALAALADTVQATVATSADPEVGQQRVRAALVGVQVQLAIARTRSGGAAVLVGDALARRAVTSDQLAALLAGRDLSERLELDDTLVLVEGRPTAAGAIVLAQRRADAVAVGQQALVRMAWGLGAVAAVSLLVGVLLARRATRPLRHTASAAHALADGRRDVAVPETGPAEVAAVAASVNTLARALAHAEARQREFLLSVSHDLRTPLTAVHGYAESLADGLIPADRVAGVGRVIGAETTRLERMVGDLLDLARLDAGQLRLDVVVMDLADLLDAAEPVWAARCAQVGIDWSVQRPGAGVVVAADPGRLRQAVDGLLENAVRVTPRGHPIVLASRVEGAEAVLEVRDGGPGLTDADLGVAFDHGALHERYRGVRAVGTGLGLALVARIAARSGGRVAAGHAPEGGASFQIRLPLARETTTR
ncbi:MAG: HAMP domain-containing sensor histidine kinase [Dermatophilaceae bacterium]